MTTLRLLACADLNGRDSGGVGWAISDLRPGWILVLGDPLPALRMQDPRDRLMAQRESWRGYGRSFVHDFVTTTVVGGGHKHSIFAAPEFRRLPEGLEDRVVRLEGVRASLQSPASMHDDGELDRERQDQVRIAPEPWIYISHVPPHGCLDIAKGGEHVGHRPLARHLERSGWPKALVLCGHVHEGFGCSERGETLVVNVACGYALVEYGPEVSRVLDLVQLWPAHGAVGGASTF